jgi:hypothetical protein
MFFFRIRRTVHQIAPEGNSNPRVVQGCAFERDVAVTGKHLGAAQ